MLRDSRVTVSAQNYKTVKQLVGQQVNLEVCSFYRLLKSNDVISSPPFRVVKSAVS